MAFACACGGRLYGVSPWERALVPGTGARVWAATEAGAPAAPCPLCGRQMRTPAPGSGAPAGLAACRTCQEVWVPSSAEAWMDAHAAPGNSGEAAAGAAPPSQCSNCGAPCSLDARGRCVYCRTQLSAPPPVLVTMAAPPSDRAGSLIAGLGLVGLSEVLNL